MDDATEAWLGHVSGLMRAGRAKRDGVRRSETYSPSCFKYGRSSDSPSPIGSSGYGDVDVEGKPAVGLAKIRGERLPLEDP